MRRTYRSALLALVLALSGCGTDERGAEVGPTSSTAGRSAAHSTSAWFCPRARARAVRSWSSSTGSAVTRRASFGRRSSRPSPIWATTRRWSSSPTGVTIPTGTTAASGSVGPIRGGRGAGSRAARVGRRSQPRRDRRDLDGRLRGLRRRTPPPGPVLRGGRPLGRNLDRARPDRAGSIRQRQGLRAPRSRRARPGRAASGRTSSGSTAATPIRSSRATTPSPPRWAWSLTGTRARTSASYWDGHWDEYLRFYANAC